ncbi:MAG: TIR domain-containing protein, partial [Chloroflexota bacterium]|nr:TIR domain-containing protein [Chloroflexota bacterium]
MSNLSTEDIQSIIAMLTLRVGGESERRALLSMAFPDFTDRPAIEYGGTDADFSALLVDTLRKFGEIKSGTPALAALLRAFRPRVGDQARIDGWIAALIAPLLPAPLAGKQHVFISYAHDDRAFVTRLIADIQRSGVTVWIDESGLEAGTPNWETAIRTAIDAASVVVYVGSPAAALSNFVGAELAIAEARRCPIFAMWAAGNHWADCAPMKLIKAQYIDLRAATYTANLPTLIAALTGRAKPAPPPPAKRITHTVDDRFASYGIDMIGRDADLQTAFTELQAGVLFIVGVGGLGKSRLAYAVMQTGDYDGVVWLRLSEVTFAEEILIQLRRHYGDESLQTPAAALARVPTDGRLLLVLDNAEAVPRERRADFVQWIADLRERRAAVLVTARETWGEVRRSRKLQPTTLHPDDAARVVIEMARAEDVELPQPFDAAAFGAAARYHPRLIEFAVIKLSDFGAESVLTELRALTSQHAAEALNEMIGITLKQMDGRDGGQARACLRRLTACVGLFDEDAARAISGLDADAFADAVKTLRAFNFLRFDPNAARYQIDELVRIAAGTDADARRAHYDYYQAFAQRVDDDQTRYDRYLVMDADSDEFAAAFAWALGGDGGNDVAAAFRLANACINLLANRARWGQLLDWFTALEDRRAALDDATRAALWNSIGIVYMNHPLGSRAINLRRAVDAYREALRFYTTDAAPLNYAMTQYNLG